MIQEIIQYLIFILSDLSSVVIVFVWLWFLLKRLFDVSEVPVLNAKPMTLTWLAVAAVRLVQPVHFWVFVREFTPETIAMSACALVVSIFAFFISYRIKRFTGLSLSIMLTSAINCLASLFYGYHYQV